MSWVFNRLSWAAALGWLDMDAKSKMQRKVKKVMREYKSGELKSSSGQKVTDQKQAVAIAMSEAKRMKK